MKRGLLLIATLALMVSLQAQVDWRLDYDYKTSGGLLAAANITNFNVSDAEFEYDWRADFTGGIWLEFPFGSRLRLEPEVLGSRYRYHSFNQEGFLNDGKIWYVNVPILLKYRLLEWLAVTAGPQADFKIDVQDDRGEAQSEDVASFGINANVGVELFPYAPATLFARYVIGFGDVEDDVDAWPGDYSNQSIHVGAKIRLGKGRVLKDMDGDGITDRLDECPDVFGYERYAGCPIPDSDNDGIDDEHDDCINVPGIARLKGCPIPDGDGDGVNDEDDKCPTVAGVARYDGCPPPDRDGDGVNDDDDKCPNTPGQARYDGCPPPDSDGDGVLDDADKCPNVKGLARYDGCPIPDSDGDGIDDEADRCPNLKGVAGMSGCPDLENTPYNVTFAFGSATLTNAGKRELDRLNDYMKTHSDVKLKIVGYTDSTGTDKVNMPLSVNRAEAAKAYLVSLGIDATRISTDGLGPADPVADNATAEGRAQNRRIEISVQ